MNIVITGASQGIGYQTAKLLSLDPKATIIVIARNDEHLSNLKKDCFELTGYTNIIPIPFDLADFDHYSQLLTTIAKCVSHLDVLINNAGVLVNKPFAAISKTELENTYCTNLFAPFLLSQALLPLLSKGTAPQIVNIGSMGGLSGTAKFTGLTAYSSSKGALSILSECLAEELKEFKIRVNCLAIGSVDTEMLKIAFPGYCAQLKASEMADFIVNFIQKSSFFFNGKTIPIASSTP